MNDGTFDGQTIVSAENLAVIWLPRVAMSDSAAYANGWVLLATPNGTVTWHNGGTDGFGAFIGIDRSRKIGVVVLSNETNVGFPDALGLWIFDRLLGNPQVDHVAKTLERVTKRFADEAETFAAPDDPRPFPPLAPLGGSFASPVFGGLRRIPRRRRRAPRYAACHLSRRPGLRLPARIDFACNCFGAG